MCKISSSSFAFLYEIDMFKMPLYLLFEQREKIPTKTGVFLTIAIISFLMVLTSRSDVFQKKVPKTLISNLPQTNRQKVSFSNKLLAIGLQGKDDGLGFIDETIFEIIVQMAKKNQDTNLQLIRKKVNLHPCTEKDFEDELIFHSLNLKNNYCLEKNISIEMKGYWDEEEMAFLEVELNICNNITMNGRCKSLEDIEKKLAVYNSFNIYFENVIVDINDYRTPIRKTVQNEYRSVDLKFKKIIELSMENIQLETDDGFIMEETQAIFNVKYDEQKIDFYAKKDLNLDRTLCIFEIYASKNFLKMERMYEKISDLLARLGGVLKALMAIGFILAKVEFGLKTKTKIMNLLFRFPNINNGKIFLKEKKKEYEKPVEVKKFDFTFFEYITFYVKRIFKMRFSKKEKLFMLGENKFSKKIEFTEILKKIQKIELLKNLILTEEQEKLFSRIRKPSINLNKLTHSDKLNDTKKTLEYFENLKKTNKLRTLDEKIMKIIEPI